MTNLKQFVIRNSNFIIIMILLLVPVISFAYNPGDPLVPCTATTGQPPCGWNDLMNLVNNIITFVLRDMVIPIAAIMSAYAGFLLVTSGGSTESRGKAKKIFTSAVVGLIIALVAWLVVSTILVILGFNGTWIGLYIKL